MSRLIRFPGVWLASLAVICMANFGLIPGSLLAIIVGIVTCLVSPQFSGTLLRKLGLSALAILVVLTVSPFAVYTYRRVTWDPIGDWTDDGVEVPLFPSHADEVSVLSNGAGTVADVRRTVPFLDVAGATYYVFVRRNYDANTRADLVFRYETTDYAIEAKPILTWSRPNQLLIHLGDGVLEQVTKQRTEIGRVEVRYDLGAARCAPLLYSWEHAFDGRQVCLKPVAVNADDR